MYIPFAIKTAYIFFLLISFPVTLSGQPRITMKVADVEATAGDSLIAVPVTISFPKDTLAGVEVHFRIEHNNNIFFASDDIRPDGMLIAADTSGALISGWEWVGINSLENDVYDLKVAALADWPDQKQTPPSLPTDDTTLVTLYFRLDTKYPIADSLKIPVRINDDSTGFSTPGGASIGITTRHERVCREFVGDSCAAWSIRRVAVRDTSVVKLEDGSIKVYNLPVKTDTETNK